MWAVAHGGGRGGLKAEAGGCGADMKARRGVDPDGLAVNVVVDGQRRHRFTTNAPQQIWKLCTCCSGCWGLGCCHVLWYSLHHATHPLDCPVMDDRTGQCKAFVSYSELTDRLLIIYAVTQKSAIHPYAAASFSEIGLRCGCRSSVHKRIRRPQSCRPSTGALARAIRLRGISPSYCCDFMGKFLVRDGAIGLVGDDGRGVRCVCSGSFFHLPARLIVCAVGTVFPPACTLGGAGFEHHAVPRMVESRERARPSKCAAP